MEELTVLVVADGLALVRELALAVRRRASITVLGPVFDERAAREALAVVVEVVVVDLDRDDDLGLALVAGLRASAPVPVVATSTAADAMTAARVLAVGGSGLIPRHEEPLRLIETLRAVSVGEIALPDGHLSSVVEYLHGVREERSRSAIAALTRREREVLALLCQGRSPAEMAAQLGVSSSTIQAHIKAVFTKLGAHSQVEAVRAAWRGGFGVPVPA